MKQSAGILFYRQGNDGRLEVLLVHPSGNYNRGKPWSIPKGLPEEGESLEDAARREAREESGVTAGPLVSLGSIDYTKSRKRVHAFASPARGEPRCASWEIDACEFVPIEQARIRLHPDQQPFLDRLQTWLQSTEASESSEQ